MLWRVSDMKRLCKLKWLIAAGTLLIAGCATLDYHPLSLTEELQYFEKNQKTFTADREWWKQYNNAELNRLVETALANNPDYIKAALNINKELYNLNLTNSDLFPTLYGTLSASSQRRIDTGDNFSSNFSGELGLNYEVDLYGKIRDLNEAQEFEYKATVMDRETARLSLVNSVVDLYFNLEYLNNSISVSQKNIAAYQNIRNI